MNELRMPITTNREGNKITKVCVEDIYKIINRVYATLDKCYNNCSDVLEGMEKDIPIPESDNLVWNGYLVIGTGISQPCLTDAFDEEIGNNIAFMKAKLNANIKKHNLLVKIWNNLINSLDSIDSELETIDSLIKKDLKGIRMHNSEYLPNIEEELNSYLI